MGRRVETIRFGQDAGLWGGVGGGGRVAEVPRGENAREASPGKGRKGREGGERFHGSDLVTVATVGIERGFLVLSCSGDARW